MFRLDTGRVFVFQIGKENLLFLPEMLFQMVFPKVNDIIFNPVRFYFVPDSLPDFPAAKQPEVVITGKQDYIFVAFHDFMI